MSRWFTLTACPPGTYDWAVQQGALDTYDELYVLRKRWGSEIPLGYEAAMDFYAAQRGITWEYPDTDCVEVWYDTSEHPLKLTLIGGNFFLKDAHGNDRPIRCSNVDESARAIAHMMELVAQLECGTHPELEQHRKVIEGYAQLYSRVQPGEELFYSLL